MHTYIHTYIVVQECLAEEEAMKEERQRRNAAPDRTQYIIV